MKILAIRGKNLASLQKPFEIDLEASPLREAGLFAITGPTGAGKTTLLDTICLALFDAVPRFTGSHRFQLEEHREAGISSTDPRNLLRVGAVEGFAEVDFRGIDHKLYRAHWSVYRARRKAEGQLQAQVMSLTCLDDGLRLGDTRSETKRIIAEKLGLDYFQFCRAVLLAQGDFANFIRSEPKKRAELLERITGTSLYTQLSIAAHQRHKLEWAALQKLGFEREALQLLDEQELDALKQTAAQLQREEQELDANLKQWEAFERDRRREFALVEAHASAVRELDEARHQADALRAQDLDAILSAQELRPLFEGHERDLRESAQLAQDRQANRDQLQAAESLALERQVQLEQAQLRWAEAESQVSREAPALQQAELLDPRIAERRALCSSEDLAVLDLDKRRNEARETTALHQEVIADATRERDTLKAWQGQRPEDQRIAAQWELWSSLLTEASQLQPELEKGSHLARLRRELEETQDALQQAELALQEADQVRQDTRTAAEILEGQARSHKPQALEDMLARLARERERMRVLDGQLVRVAELSARKAELQDRIDLTQRDIERLERVLPELERAGELISGRRAEADRALQLAQASQDLAQRRAELLHPGQPCPLCGSSEHPWHALRDQHDLLEAQRLRVSELDHEQRALREQQARATAQLEAQRRDATAFARDQAVLIDPLNALQSEVRTAWRELVPELAEPQRAELQRRSDELDQRERRGRADQESARLAQKQAESAAAQAQSAAAAWERCHQGREQARTEAAACERRFNEQSQQHTQVALRWEALLLKLKPLEELGLDRAALRQQPQDLCRHYRERVTRWQENHDRVQQLERDLLERASLLSAAQASEQAQLERLNERRQKRDALAVELRDWVVQRASLFEGRDTQSVRRGHEQLLQTCRQELEQAREDRNRVAHQITSLGEQQDQLALRDQDQQERTTASRAELDRELARTGLDLARLRAYLAYDSAWCREKQEAMRQADLRVSACQSILQERAEALAQQRAQSLKLPEGVDLEASLAEVRRSLESTREERHRALARVQDDAERRQRHQQLGPAYQAQERRTDLWKAMSDLIGSHDGARFRRFAQSLTLDLLVHSANQHLVELQPRYQLKRVAGDELEMLVVDLDMADEERTLSGLSGGETFLVSLALALGLASLNAEGRQIESLFIDEGFGALDAHSLDAALDTLDQLQANGRQVGIISHVQAVADRVSCRIQVVREGNGASTIKIK